MAGNTSKTNEKKTLEYGEDEELKDFCENFTFPDSVS